MAAQCSVPRAPDSQAVEKAIQRRAGRGTPGTRTAARASVACGAGTGVGLPGEKKEGVDNKVEEGWRTGRRT